MIKINIYLVLVGLCLTISFFPQPGRAEIVDRVVAIVNDEVISLYELNQMLKPYEEKLHEARYPVEKEMAMLAKMREDILQKMIEQKLTDQQIKEKKITVSDDEIQNAIERIKSSQMITEEQLRSELKNEGIDYEEYRDRIREQILRAKLLNVEIRSKIVITNDDVKAYYDSHPEIYKSEKKYHLRNIIMSYRTDEEKNKKVREKMQMVLEKLKAGEPFEAMAKQYSESTLAAEGGDLGLFSLNEMSDQFQKAVSGLKPGQFSDILETDQGYQIVYLQDISDAAAKSLEQAKPEIEEILYQQFLEKKFQEWVEDLKERSYIKIIR